MRTEYQAFLIGPGQNLPVRSFGPTVVSMSAFAHVFYEDKLCYYCRGNLDGKFSRPRYKNKSTTSRCKKEFCNERFTTKTGYTMILYIEIVNIVKKYLVQGT